MTRFDDNGRPRKRFIYIPLVQRLVEQFKLAPRVETMRYRSTYEHDPDVTKDVFDSVHYRSLLGKHVNVNGKDRAYNHFSEPRDIALGLSTDGFAPFRRRKSTAWPLILFNYNLPPEIRFHIRNILCVGVIPGPKKPKDFDSFLWPLVQELLRLALGVRAFDITTMERFALHAYLTVVFGDMPAVSMVMCMKGHNGILPCRMCKIKGLRIPNSRGTTHYVPLDRSQHPSVRTSGGPAKYDPANLPYRTHDEIMSQAHEVQFAPTQAESARLATSYGVKSIPLLSCLSSLSFPQSFPCDFMHLIYENVINNLVLLWTGNYKGLDEGTGSYEFMPTVWDAIGVATAASGPTIPSAFGASPPDVANNKTACTADSWSFWTLYLAPVLLHNKFQRAEYYKHFIKLVKLIHLCLQFEYSKGDIALIRSGFQEWVEEYEKYIFEHIYVSWH